MPGHVAHARVGVIDPEVHDPTRGIPDRRLDRHALEHRVEHAPQARLRGLERVTRIDLVRDVPRDRDVAHRDAVTIDDRRDREIRDPVRAVSAAVAEHSGPRAPAGQRPPQILEHLWRQITREAAERILEGFSGRDDPEVIEGGVRKLEVARRARDQDRLGCLGDRLRELAVLRHQLVPVCHVCDRAHHPHRSSGMIEGQGSAPMDPTGFPGVLADHPVLAVERPALLEHLRGEVRDHRITVRRMHDRAPGLHGSFEGLVDPEDPVEAA